MRQKLTTACKTGASNALGLVAARSKPAAQIPEFSLMDSARQAKSAAYDQILDQPRSAEPITDLARKKARSLVRNLSKDADEPVSDRVVAFMVQEISTVDYYKVAVHGMATAPISCVRAYSDQLAGSIAWQLTDTYYTNPTLDDITMTVDAYARLGIHDASGATNWAGMKLARLYTELVSTRFMYDIFEQLEPLSGTELTELEAANNSLWQSCEQLRRFAVANVIAPTNLSGIRQWSVLAGNDVRASIKESLEINQSIPGLSEDLAIDPQPTRYSLDGMRALFVATNGNFTVSEPQLIPITAGNRNLGSHLHIGAEPAYEGGPDNSTSLLLGNDGNLYTLAGLPLKTLCDDAGFSDAYEQVRSEILALHFDLVVPTYVQKSLLNADRETVEANTNWGIKERLRYLVLARRKYLADHSKEIRDDLKKHQSKFGGSDGTHPVIGHVREIDPRYKAGTEARMWAWEEDRRILAPFGETWVRGHRKPNQKAQASPVRRAVVASGQFAALQATRKK